MPRNKAAHAHYRIQRLPSTEFAAKLEFSESVYYRELFLRGGRFRGWQRGIVQGSKVQGRRRSELAQAARLKFDGYSYWVSNFFNQAITSGG
jgi:hypothetical protein